MTLFQILEVIYYGDGENVQFVTKVDTGHGKHLET